MLDFTYFFTDFIGLILGGSWLNNFMAKNSEHLCPKVALNFGRYCNFPRKQNFSLKKIPYQKVYFNIRNTKVHAWKHPFKRNLMSYMLPLFSTGSTNLSLAECKLLSEQFNRWSRKLFNGWINYTIHWARNGNGGDQRRTSTIDCRKFPG